MSEIETDYLIVGTGALSMSFADSLLDRCDAHITFIDQHPRPGGHWNIAYPFVTLHQPSATYGLNSMDLDDGRAFTASVPATHKRKFTIADGVRVTMPGELPGTG